MVPSSSTAPAVTEGIARCAAVLENPAELRSQVEQLRAQAGEAALFAAALFDLERARRGDAEARTQLLEVADSLLVFWRDRSGDSLANLHPALGPLWASASELLASFEVKRFKRALDACWEARADVEALQEAIKGLLPPTNRRVEFAACLYHLELARLQVATSRGEFARRAGLVHEAYHSKEIAEELVGEDPGLKHLWSDLIPYLDEFFEALEEEAERKQRSKAITTPGGEAVPAPTAPPPPRPSTPVAAAPPTPPPPRPSAPAAVEPAPAPTAPSFTPSHGMTAIDAPSSLATMILLVAESTATPPGW